ncbi:MAG: hypothetical protein ACRCVT_04095 [Leadbetterella sp.]
MGSYSVIEATKEKNSGSDPFSGKDIKYRISSITVLIKTIVTRLGFSLLLRDIAPLVKSKSSSSRKSQAQKKANATHHSLTWDFAVFIVLE